MRLLISIAIVLLGLIPPAALAADAAGTYFTPGGVGAAGCHQYLGVRDRARNAKPVEGQIPEIELFNVFITGFQTAFNMQTPQTCDIFGGLKPDQILAWLDNFCRSQPHRHFALALVALTEANHPTRAVACK